jgi:hypothetical protein
MFALPTANPGKQRIDGFNFFNFKLMSALAHVTEEETVG